MSNSATPPAPKAKKPTPIPESGAGLLPWWTEAGEGAEVGVAPPGNGAGPGTVVAPWGAAVSGELALEWVGNTTGATEVPPSAPTWLGDIPV